MKKNMKKILKFIYCIIILIIILCSCSVIYNKIKHPKSPITIFGYQLYVDVTNSMVPNLRVNDILIVKKSKKENIKVDDIITFREDDSTVTHRVIEIIEDAGETAYKTKGDNNSFEDDRLVPYKEVEGKYLFKIPYLGFFITDKISLILLIILILILSYFPYTDFDFLKKNKTEEL